MVVTKVSGGEVYLTYHDTDTHNRPFQDIRAKYPNSWWYAHRT